MDLGLSSPGAHRKHKAVSKSPGLCVVCGSLSGEWERCAVGRQGSTLRQAEASLKIRPGAPHAPVRGWWHGQAQLCLGAGSAWCGAGARGMGVHSLCRQQCLGEAWECLPQLQSLSPLFRVSLAVHSAGATVAELQLMPPCHQSILLVAVGTTCHASWPAGALPRVPEGRALRRTG